MVFDASLIRINDVNDLEGYDSYTYLEIEAGLPPTSETIERLGHEPNGYFWEGVARWLLAKRVVGDIGEADPEGGAFLTRGGRPQLEALAEALMPYLTQEGAITALIEEADAAGHDFEN